MKIVFNESFGILSYAQQAAYRKFNVSPSDHWDLEDLLGVENHAVITAAVKDHSPGGNFSTWKLRDSINFG